MSESEKPSLDLGKLLRMQAAVMKAAQMEATYEAGQALVHAYMGLRAEMLALLLDNQLPDLGAECERLFQPMDEPANFNPVFDPERSRWALASAAKEAQTKLGMLSGWIQGLIDELTLEEKIVAEAEAKARLAVKPPLGFTSKAQEE
jgi:hypothetical protein